MTAESAQVLDNQTNRVADYINRHLDGAKSFRAVSAYFTIQGYGLLSDNLDGPADVRFLFGDPDSLDDLDPGKKEEKRFEIREGGLHPTYTLNQKPLAKECWEWASRESVQIRSVSQSNFLHGKMYLMESPNNLAGVVGSSNLTRRGLGYGESPNIEINLADSNADTVVQLRKWFDRLWADANITIDVKQDVLDALQRAGRDYAPELIYYKTLYELFRDEIEERKIHGDGRRQTTLKDSQVWNKLYAFQQDGASAIISKIQKHNGCMLADSVGLGKTYAALAVIKYFEQRNERVLVLCPRKLRDNWSLYQAANNHRRNPFPEDRFGYTLLSHTDLSRERGLVGGVDLANFNWTNYDLVVIDESHNFRNKAGNRYNTLLEEVFGKGVNTKVLMLSATPVNTSFRDLESQLRLMGRDDHFHESLGIGSIGNTTKAAQKVFNKWEEKSRPDNRDKSKLLEDIGPDLFRLLNAVSISRSRKHVQQFYADEMVRVGTFPERGAPDNRFPKTDLDEELSYEELADNIGDFKLSLYMPSHYLLDPGMVLDPARRNIDQLNSEKFLVGMMRTNLLKRLESSPESLRLTLKRTICKIESILDKINHGEEIRPDDAQPDEDTNDEDDDYTFVGTKRVRYRLDQIDLVKWEKDLKRDKRILNNALRQVEAITPERDGKLNALIQDIRNKIEKPTRDKGGKPNRKMLVFTTFTDTAKYLYEQLGELSRELGIKMAMITGSERQTQLGRSDFNEILANFAPVAAGQGGTDGEIDLMIATDCISEGQNLQDCDAVLNYDIHWNPVRLIQRFGRIDRIGSHNRIVNMINYWPTDDMDEYLRLRNRVRTRMAIADITATGHNDPLNPPGDGHNFRDEQLRQLRYDIIDLDEQDSVGLGDFVTEDFLAQLMAHLEKNRKRLESMPLGVYAVTHQEPHAPPGVVFFLKQRNAGSDRRRRPASPVHPFYLVYLHADGTLGYGCGSPKQVLTAFRAVSAGKDLPLQDLCDNFDRETKYGRNMGQHDRLLEITLAHIKQSNRRRQAKNMGRDGASDFVVPEMSESPRTGSDFDLVTWLAIMPGDKND